ncbi:hypothetical protein PENTCL1PPCAC_12820, partial [Pristionchus entomophagus]
KNGAADCSVRVALQMFRKTREISKANDRKAPKVLRSVGYDFCEAVELAVAAAADWAAVKRECVMMEMGEKEGNPPQTTHNSIDGTDETTVIEDEKEIKREVEKEEVRKMSEVANTYHAETETDCVAFDSTPPTPIKIEPVDDLIPYTDDNSTLIEVDENQSMMDIQAEEEIMQPPPKKRKRKSAAIDAPPADDVAAAHKEELQQLQQNHAV